VCITWLWSGTRQGELAEFTATGRQLHMSGATVRYFENNRITGHWQKADRMSVFQQLNSFQGQNAN